MKCVIVINVVYLCYTVVFSIIRFEIKVVFIIKMFFVVFSRGIKVDSYNRKFFEFFFKLVGEPATISRLVIDNRNVFFGKIGKNK